MAHRTAPFGRRVLIVAPFGRDAASVAGLLARAGYEASALPDLDAVAAALDDQAGVVLLTEEALAGAVDGLVAAIRAQPDWSDIPFVMLAAARSGTGARKDPLIGRLPDGMANAVVLERPLGGDSLVSAVALAMRSRQRQFDMRDRLAELARSEGRLRLATDAADIGTWDFDPVTGALAWDARCKALFGLPPHAVVSYETGFLAGLHADDRAGADAAVAAALDPAGDGDFAIEYRTVGIEDGIERWVAARGGAIFADGRAVRFIGTVIDITAPRRAQEALHASEAALRGESRALETLNGIGRSLTAELDLDRVVQSAVDAATELTGARIGAFFYNRADVAGDRLSLYALTGAPREAFDHYPPPRHTAVFAPTFTGEGPVRSGDITGDPRYGLSDTYWGMPKGHPAVVSYLAVPVVSRSGEVVGGLLFGHPERDRFDERAERLALGIAAQAAVAIDNARLFDAARRARAQLEAKVAERTAALEAEMASRDRAEAALRQSHKMEAVGQLTGGIAHDFNNMLTGVIGAMDIMKRRLAAGRVDDLPRFMDAAATSANRAAALTQRLLAFSRRQSLDARPLDVGALIASLGDLLQRSVHENIRLAVVPGAGVPLAVADANQLENAILNLVINARDAMPDGGDLTIETARATFDAAFAATPSDAPAGDYVLIAISDTGTGMTTEVLERAVDPFFSTKPQGQGTGLGLSMVYGFARQSGGQLRIHSSPGEGTTVKLYLPVAASDTAPTAAAPSAPLAEGHGQTVLLVEDDPSVRLLVREVLEELGYRTVEAGSADEALPIVASSRTIDLMVSDVGLPGMSGRDLADHVRRHRPALPILFVTGYAERAAERSLFLGEGMAMITKPFAIEELADKVAAMMPA